MRRVNATSDMAADSFLHAIVHDLKAPLGVIRSYSLELEQALSEGVVEQSDIQAITSASEESIKLVQDLLAVFKLQKSQTELPLAPLSIDRELRIVKDELSGVSKNYQREIKIRGLKRGSTAVMANQWYLRRSLSNLLQNAIKYSHGKKPIVLKSIQTKGFTELQVIDNGPELSNVDLLSLQGSLSGFKTKRSAGSSNLGLYLTGRMVEAMNIEVLYQPQDKGNVFMLRIPNIQQLSLF